MKKPEYKPRPVLIRIRATQEEVIANPCANGWFRGRLFIHASAAKLVKVLEEQ
jgi:hypothetical protein